MSIGEARPRSDMLKLAQKFISRLGLPFLKIEIAGSIRRMKPFVRDIDLVAVIDGADDKFYLNTKLGAIWGYQKTNPGKAKREGMFEGVKVQVLETTKDSYGAAMLMATGNAQFNVIMRHHAKEKGFLLNQYGLFNKFGVCVAQKREEDIFRMLGMEYHLPIQREK